jgi:hypothetical protein
LLASFLPYGVETKMSNVGSDIEKAPLTGGPPSPMGSMNGAKVKGFSQLAAPSPWTFMWFGAAICVMVGSIISLVEEIFSLEWVDALEMAYLFLFGALLAIVDTPLFTSLHIVIHIRQACNRFLAIVTRVTGKGVVYMFLGCTLWSSMWTNLEDGFMLILAFFLGIFIFFTGIISVLLGLCMSKNLNVVRAQLKKEGVVLKDQFEKFARANREAGLTAEEFERMSVSLPQPTRFEGSDLKLVFSGISSDPNRTFISQQDLENWVYGGMIFI